MQRTDAENAANDKDLIARIEQLGADLTKPRHVDVHLSARTADAAQVTASALRHEGWEVTVWTLEDKWAVVGSKPAILVNSQAIRELRDHYEQLASRVGVTFTGWSTQATP